MYTTPPHYTIPGDGIPKPKILSPEVCYTLSYTVRCCHTGNFVWRVLLLPPQYSNMQRQYPAGISAGVPAI